MIKFYLKARLVEELGNNFFREAKLEARKLKENLQICDQGVSGGCFTGQSPKFCHTRTGPWSGMRPVPQCRSLLPFPFPEGDFREPGSIISFFISPSLGRRIRFISEMLWTGFKPFPPVSRRIHCLNLHFTIFRFL